MSLERLQKILAGAGIASRRAAEAIISAGRVRVNGRVVRELGTKADPVKDKIEVDNKRISAEDLVYIVLHKPRNVVSTLDDPEGRDTVADLVNKIPVRVYPVGRLDYATSGVLLMTNDGAFTQALLHPRTKVPKTYVIKLDRSVSDADLEPWRKGMLLDDGKTLPADAHVLRHEAGKAWIQVTLYEGRNQQLRRMATASGYLAMRLARISFAGIDHADLRPGQWRPLSVEEMRKLQKTYGVPQRIRAQRSLLTLRKTEEPRAPRAARAARGATTRTKRKPRR